MPKPLLFSGLSEGEQRDLLAARQPRQLKRRDVLGQQGEPADLSHLCSTPRAEIFEDRTGGPLVEGDAVTFLPNVVELQPENRTHHVRLDIVAQEIETSRGAIGQIVATSRAGTMTSITPPMQH